MIKSKINDIDVSIIDQSGAQHRLSEIPQKIKLLYFASGHCQSCLKHHIALQNFYNCVNADELNLEIIYVGKDTNDAYFHNFLKMMPWLAVEFVDPNREEVFKKFNVTAIPMIILIDNEGHRIGATDYTDAIINAKEPPEIILKSIEDTIKSENKNEALIDT